MNRGKLRFRRVVATVAVLASSLAGVVTQVPSAQAATSSSLISAADCKANQAAGTIHYLSNYNWVMSPGIIDALAANNLGYYKDMCLNVSLGASSSSIEQLVASDKAQMARDGSPDQLMQGDSAGEATVGVATYANVTINTLLVLANSKITKLSQLNHTTIGSSGPLPPQVTAMLQKGGVDMSTVKVVNTGYNPLFLARKQVVALSAYKSNEPILLANDGYKTRQFDPSAYGVKSTNATILANPSFLKAHPTAVADFVRATLHGFAYCRANANACINMGAAKSGGTKAYDVPVERQRWSIESGEAVNSPLPGKGIGTQTVAQWTPDFNLLEKQKIIKPGLSLDGMLNTTIVPTLYKGTKLIWP